MGHASGHQTKFSKVFDHAPLIETSLYVSIDPDQFFCIFLGQWRF